MEKTKETLQVEVKKEVDSTDITSEGGDMKVSKSKTTKKSSAKQEDGSYKVNLSKTTKTKKDAVREEVSTDKKKFTKTRRRRRR